MNFSKERLLQVRKSLGINKAEAARRLNMSAMGYGRYESGEREPSFQTVSYIAEVFGTSTDFLYGQTEEALSSTITISATRSPEIYALVKELMDNEVLVGRLLAYLSKLKE